MNGLTGCLRGATILGLAAVLNFSSAGGAQAADSFSFKRIATYPVFMNTCDGMPDDCVDTETVAEIVASSTDGRTLIYTDSETENIGFVDITTPSAPKGRGLLAVGGEPTSVAVSGVYALVAVNTSEDFVNTSGHLNVVHIPTQTIVRTIDLGGQPDSVAVSEDLRFAAIAIENERNEDLCVGGAFDGQEADEDACENGGGRLSWLPQMPAGFLVIVDMNGDPKFWKSRVVSMTGIADKFPTDPEPEYVSINQSKIAAVTLQENNHIVLVDLRTGKVVGDFSAGTVDLSDVDIEENDLIEPNAELAAVPREPDAVTWINNRLLATADEGDLEGGSRGFTVFDTTGNVVSAAGNAVEHLVTRLGHYPESRSENKGNEAEGIAQGRYGAQHTLFVGLERSSVVAVYEVESNGSTTYKQTLPTGVGPEGLLPIPQRNLFVTASEVDDRDGNIRSSLSIYEWSPGAPAYPTIMSADRPDGGPIPWGALSAVAGDPDDPNLAFAVYDSYYRESRIFAVDTSASPAVITSEIVLMEESAAGEGLTTLDLDPEGLAVRGSGTGFWVVSEGAGGCSAVGDCTGVVSPNLLLRVTARGVVMEKITLPPAVNDRQIRFGFEGVARTGFGADEFVYVAFQRGWLEDPAGYVRIGRYQPSTGEWRFFYYPLDKPTSPNGGWVGLSEVAAIDEHTLAILERDNRGGPDATIKRIYSVSIEGVEPMLQGGEFPMLSKTLVRNVLPDLAGAHGLVIEKVEGMGILANGDVIITTDNDGVEDNSGETQWINLGDIF